jgi:hypothetical protein
MASAQATASIRVRPADISGTLGMNCKLDREAHCRRSNGRSSYDHGSPASENGEDSRGLLGRKTAAVFSGRCRPS